MNSSYRIALGAVAGVVLMANAGFAQTVFTGTNVADDLNEDLIDAIEDDAERDLDRFGNEGRPDGFTGSVALRGTASSGNTKESDVGIGADLNWVRGVNGVNLALNYAYGDTDGSRTKEDLFYGLEYTRDLNTRTFGFAKIQGAVDEFSSFESDTFVSFGLGYRVVNTADTQWSVQGGPGYRFADLSDVADANISEGALGLSSDYANKLSDTVWLTNDTDIVASESDTVVFNDLAVSVSMTDMLALRTSVLTEFHTDPADNSKSTDNTFGVSLVYSFN